MGAVRDVAIPPCIPWGHASPSWGQDVGLDPCTLKLRLRMISRAFLEAALSFFSLWGAAAAALGASAA